MSQRAGVVAGGLVAAGFLAYMMSGKRTTSSNNVPAEHGTNAQNNALSAQEFKSRSDNPHSSSGVDLKQAKANSEASQHKSTPKTAITNDGRTPPPGSATNAPTSSRS